MFKYFKKRHVCDYIMHPFIVLPLALVAFGVTNAQYMLFKSAASWKYILKYILNSLGKTLQIVPMK